MSEEERILEQVEHFLSLSDPNSSYEQLNTYLKECPNFYQYLLHFLLLDGESVVVRVTALSIISNNYTIIFDENPESEEIIISQLFSNAANFCQIESMAKIFAVLLQRLITEDPSMAVSIFQLIATLIGSEETILGALYILKEISSNLDTTIDQELLEPLPELIKVEAFRYEALNVSLNIASQYQSVIQSVIPVIFETCESYDEPCLVVAAKVCALYYTYNEEEECIKFFASVLSNDSESLTYDLIDYIYPDAEQYNPQPELIQSLILKVQTHDEDPLIDGICSSVQDIIHKIANSHLEQFLPIYTELLDQIEDNGWKMRALYPILDLIPNSAEYLPFVEEMIGTEEKGDAILDLFAISGAVPAVTNAAIDVSLSNLQDENPYVSKVCLFTLNSLFSGEFEVTEERFAALIQVFASIEQALNSSESEEATSSLLYFFSYFLYIFYLFIATMPEFDMSANEEFFNELCTFIQEENENSLIFCDSLSIIAEIITKANVEFCEAFAALGERALEVVNKGDDNMVCNACYILKALVEKYPEGMASLPYFLTIISSLYKKLDERFDTDIRDMIGNIWAIICIIFENIPDLPEEVYGDAFQLAQNFYNGFNYSASLYIARVFLIIGENIETPDLIRLRNRSLLIMRLSNAEEGVSTPITEFISLCERLITERGDAPEEGE